MKTSSLLLGLFPAIVLTGCLAPGERAESRTCTSDGTCVTKCPTGETCSPDTPNGLFFSGSNTFMNVFDSSPKRTAVGGTQTILASGVDSKGSSFGVDFDAAGTNVIGIESVAPPGVTVRGEGEGSGYLRLVEQGTDILYDRIELTVGAVARIHAVPAIEFQHDPFGAPSLDWALFAGSQVNLGVMLRDAGDTTLVDESMSIALSGSASGSPHTNQWDELTASAGNAGQAILTATIGGQSFDETLPVVDTLTDIVTISNDALKPLAAGTERQICFRAIADKYAVAGASFILDASGALTPEDTSTSCILVKANAAGTGTVIVESAGIKRSFSIPVVKSLAADAPSQKAEARPRGPVPGERAR
jgi:hypothetical protein